MMILVHLWRLDHAIVALDFQELLAAYIVPFYVGDTGILPSFVNCDAVLKFFFLLGKRAAMRGAVLLTFIYWNFG
jgi:hypothetical protein